MALRLLYPASTVSDGGWGQVGAATLHEALADPAGLPDVDTYAGWSNAVADGEMRLTLDAFVLPTAVVISRIELYYRVRAAGGDPGGRTIQPLVVTTADAYGDEELIVEEEEVEQLQVWELDPDTGRPFTPALLAAGLVIGFRSLYAVTQVASLAVSQAYGRVFYEPISPQLEQVRDAASRKLFRFSRRRPTLTKEVPQAIGLEATILAPLAVHHFAGPSVDGNGWGIEEWAREDFVVLERTPHPSRGTVTLVLEAARWLRYLYRDVAHVEGASATGIEEGVARVTNGREHGFARPSTGTVIDAGSGLIVEHTAHTKRYDVEGLVLERDATGGLLNSMFRLGLTHWTTTGAVSAETDRSNLADSTVSVNVAVIDGAGYVEQTGGLTYTGKVSILVDYLEAVTQDGRLCVQRGVDSKWWRASDDTWQVAEQQNAIALSAAWAEHVAIPNVGASPTAITVRVRGAGTGDLQLQGIHVTELPWASTRILTEGVTVTRAADAYTVEHTGGVPFWHRDSGTFLIQFVSFWTMTEVNSTNLFHLLWIPFGAGESVEVFLQASTQRLIFRRTHGSVDYDAWVDASAITRGGLYTVAVRWISSAGELGLAEDTQQVFLDGVKGTDVVGAVPTEATCTVEIGGKAAAGTAIDGCVRHIRSTQLVWRDEEIARYPAA